MNHFSRISRRKFSQAMLGNALGASSGLLSYHAQAQSQIPHRLILIFLDGGWNTHFATDPVVFEKSTSGNFEKVFKTEPITTVPGKNQLIVGSGWAEATSAFAMVPTCFVNGITLDVTVHEVGMELMVAGLSASLRSDAPCNVITALLGDESPNFPEHLILGSDLPLRTVKQGISGSNIGEIASTLRSPSKHYKDATWAVGQSMVKALNAAHRKTLGGAALKKSEQWEEIREKVFASSAEQGTAVMLTPDVKNRYNTESSTIANRLAGAYMALKSNLTNYVAVTFGGFDTHSNEMTRQLPLQKEVAAAFSKLIFDLASTPEPLAPELMLIDTTTVYVTSEFARTPTFNGSDGTDHWPSASAILCGKGVIDNQVVGKTSVEGDPMAWSNGKAINSAKGPFLMPQDLVATIVSYFGREKLANRISGGRIHGIFA